MALPDLATLFLKFPIGKRRSHKFRGLVQSGVPNNFLLVRPLAGVPLGRLTTPEKQINDANHPLLEVVTLPPSFNCGIPRI